MPELHVVCRESGARRSADGKRDAARVTHCLALCSNVDAGRPPEARGAVRGGRPRQALRRRPPPRDPAADFAYGCGGYGGAVEPHVIEGHGVAARICELAEKIGADLIVMGTHGRTGLAHVFLGSVAERTLRSAPCPVLSVQAREEDDARRRARC